MRGPRCGGPTAAPLGCITGGDVSSGSRARQRGTSRAIASTMAKRLGRCPFLVQERSRRDAPILRDVPRYHEERARCPSLRDGKHARPNSASARPCSRPRGRAPSCRLCRVYPAASCAISSSAQKSSRQPSEPEIATPVALAALAHELNRPCRSAHLDAVAVPTVRRAAGRHCGRIALAAASSRFNPDELG